MGEPFVNRSALKHLDPHRLPRREPTQRQLRPRRRGCRSRPCLRRAPATPQIGPRGGSNRRHFVRESDKKQLLDAFRVLPGAACCVYVVAGHGRPVDQRAEAIQRLVGFLVAGGLDRLVFDHVDDVQQRRDRQTLAKVLRLVDVSYGFEPAQSSEPMLWVPDAIAWCAGRPEWRHHLGGWVQFAR